MKTYQTLLLASIAALGLAACSSLDTTDYSSGSSMSKGMTGSSDDATTSPSINENMATGSPANGEVSRNNRNEDSVRPDPSQQ